MSILWVIETSNISWFLFGWKSLLMPYSNAVDVSLIEVHYTAKCIRLHIHTNLSDIPWIILLGLILLAAPSAAIEASTLIGMLSTSIPKGFYQVEIRLLCSPVMVFHTKPVGTVRGQTVLHEIVQNMVYWSINHSFHRNLGAKIHSWTLTPRHNPPPVLCIMQSDPIQSRTQEMPPPASLSAISPWRSGLMVLNALEK